MSKLRAETLHRIQAGLDEQERNKKIAGHSRSSSRTSGGPDNQDDSSLVESSELLDEQVASKVVDASSTEALVNKDPEYIQLRDACVQLVDNQ